MFGVVDRLETPPRDLIRLQLGLMANCWQNLKAVNWFCLCCSARLSRVL